MATQMRLTGGEEGAAGARRDARRECLRSGEVQFICQPTLLRRLPGYRRRCGHRPTVTPFQPTSSFALRCCHCFRHYARYFCCQVDILQRPPAAARPLSLRRYAAADCRAAATPLLITQRHDFSCRCHAACCCEFDAAILPSRRFRFHAYA